MSKGRMRTSALLAVVTGISVWIITSWLRAKNDSMFHAGQIEKDDWVLQQGTLEILRFVALAAIVAAAVWLLVMLFMTRKQSRRVL